MSDLCFTLPGPPEVRHADQVLLFFTRKELALLLYLAVEGRLHLRENLSEIFWPEVGDDLLSDTWLAELSPYSLIQGFRYCVVVPSCHTSECRAGRQHKWLY
jgi:hypothetical protein